MFLAIAIPTKMWLIHSGIGAVATGAVVTGVGSTRLLKGLEAVLRNE
jgi:hypothetical protein